MGGGYVRRFNGIYLMKTDGFVNELGIRVFFITLSGAIHGWMREAEDSLLALLG